MKWVTQLRTRNSYMRDLNKYCSLFYKSAQHPPILTELYENNWVLNSSENQATALEA